MCGFKLMSNGSFKKTTDCGDPKCPDSANHKK